MMDFQINSSEAQILEMSLRGYVYGVAVTDE